MKVLWLTSGPDVPSTRYRVLPYVQRLANLGITSVIAHSQPAKYQRWPLLGWRASHAVRKAIRALELRQAQWWGCQCIVIEREIFDDPTWNFEAAFRKTTSRLILDVDDALFLRYPDKFAHIARLCDHIMAGNELLAEVCREYCPHVAVIPTAIDLTNATWPKTPSANATPVIGWIGTPGNLPYLQIIWPALENLWLRRRFVFRIVTRLSGQDLRNITSSTFPIEFQEWNADVAEQHISQFDVGIMPLPDEPWERYKCGFKLLQYMAIGVPAVASPVGVNRSIIQQGVNGFLASDNDQWEHSLDVLLGQPALVHNITRAARETIECSFSVDQLSPRVAAILQGS